MGKSIDLTGKTFGRWYVKGFAYSKGRKGGKYWNCICECLNEKIISGGSLKGGKSQSCGCLCRENKINDLTGIRFGHLTVIKESDSVRKDYDPHHSYWLCKCDCGNEKIFSSQRLIRGGAKTCGCRMK